MAKMYFPDCRLENLLFCALIVQSSGIRTAFGDEKRFVNFEHFSSFESIGVKRLCYAAVSQSTTKNLCIGHLSLFSQDCE